MDRSLDLLISPRFRQWLYGIVLVTVPILVVYGIVGAEDAALWVALAGAILGQGVALTAITQQRKAGILPGEPEDTP